MNLKNNLIAIGIGTALVASLFIAGMGQVWENYRLEKEEAVAMLQSVKITSVETESRGLVRARFVPLNKQLFVTTYPASARIEVRVTDLWATVRPAKTLRPGAVGKLTLVKDASFRVPAEFVFEAERAPSM